ncbi:glycoside hydrolase family 5 protein [Asticcacaulis sp.]|uniref:glycoside hydrolase family 5 protein n=1 Tax=Asticcacaulis sp. TaxID=1872648 RepID=UPI00391B4636
MAFSLFAIFASPSFGEIRESSYARFPAGKCLNIEDIDRLDESDIQVLLLDLKNANVVSVRLPFHIDEHKSRDQASGLIDEYYVDSIKDKALAFAKSGVTVVLDAHSINDIYGSEATTETLSSYWIELAKKLRYLPKNVYFELLNEPKSSINLNFYLSSYEKAVREIRKIDNNRVLIVGSPWYSHYKGLSKLKVLNDYNIIYTFHYYDPMEFTHQNASWLPRYRGIKASYGESTDVKRLKEARVEVRKFIQATGRTPFLGEFGVIKYAAASERNEYIRDVSSVFSSLEIQGCLWSWTKEGGAFSIKNGVHLDENIMTNFKTPSVR